MEFLKIILLIFHFIGLAALLGSVMVQIKDMRAGTARIIPGMIHGAWTMAITGIALYGVNMAIGADVNHMKLGIKFLFVVAALVLVMMYRKRETAPSWAVGTIGGLTLLNVILAVAW